MSMFWDESLETTPPSPRIHPISISSSESNSMQLSISNPHDFLSDKGAFRPIYYDIRVKVSPGIQRENLSSPKVKSWRKRGYGKEGCSCHHLLRNLGELRKNPWENKMLVWSSLLSAKTSHKKMISGLDQSLITNFTYKVWRLANAKAWWFPIETLMLTSWHEG
jgi:hypothetical protein